MKTACASALVRFWLLPSLLLASALIGTPKAEAAVVTKAASGTDLTNGASWGGSAPTATDTATWSSASLGAGLTLGSPASWQGVTVIGAASHIDITGAGPLTLGSGGINMAGSTVNATLGSPLNLAAGQTWKVATNRTLTASGVISGNGALTIGSAPPIVNYPLYLSTNSGSPTVAFPGVSLSSIVTAGGTMNGEWIGSSKATTTYFFTNNGTTATYQLQFYDSTHTKVAKVQLTQSGANVVAYQVYARYMNGNFLGQNFDNFTPDGVAPVGAGGYGVESSYAETGTTPSGTVLLSGTNIHTGTTTITRGSLRAGGTSAFGVNSALTIANTSGASLDLNGFNNSIGSLAGAGTVELGNGTLTTGGNNTDTTFSGVISGIGGGFTKIGSGTQTLSGNNTFSGITSVSAGTLKLRNTGTFTSPLISNSGVVSMLSDDSGVLVINGKLSGEGTWTVDGPGTGTMYQNRVLLRGDGSDNNGVIRVINGGKLFVDRQVNAIGDSAGVEVGASGLFYIYQGVAETIGGLSGAGNVDGGDTAGISALTVGGGNATATFSGKLRNGSSTLTLTKIGAGTQTLSGDSTYTGTTTVSGGTLQVSGSLSRSPVTVAAGAALTGTGVLGSATTVSGTLSPGGTGIGTLTVSNTVTLLAAATTSMNLKSAGGILTTDKLQVDAILTYGGTLAVTRDPASSDFALGDQFILFGASSYAGSFGAVTLPALPTGLEWDTSRLKIDGSIAVVNTNASTAPVFEPPPGAYAGAQSVTLTAASGATIYYTTDGTTPTAASPHGLSPVTGIIIPADATRTLKAYATLAGQAASQVISGTYVTVSVKTWITAGGGSWNVGANWQNGVVPGGVGAFADFSKVNLAADAAVTLDGARTVGTLMFGDTVPNRNWILNTGSSGSLTLNTVSGRPVIGVANQTTTINAVLTGAKGFLKSGEGTLLLSGTNTISGGVVVSQGELRTSNNLAAGTNTITLGDANTGAGNIKWLFNGGGSPANGVIVANQGTGTVTIGSYSSGTYTEPSGPLTLNRPVIFQDGSGDRTSFTGRISGNPGTITLTGTRVTFSDPSNDFTGDVIVSNGTVYQDNAEGAVPDWVNFNLNGPAAVFRLNGYNEAINALSGNGVVQIGSGSNITITVGAGNGSGSFAGAIQDGASALYFTKAGTGSQSLAGTCTHTGNTTVAAGTLLINGSVASSPVTVAVGATLGGVGSLGRVTTVNGTLAPGSNGVGALTVNNTLALAATSKTLMEITKTGGLATFDRVLGVTSLTMGGTLTVTASGESLQVGDSFRLFTATAYNGAFTTMNLPAGYVWNTSQLATNGTLTVTGINHPPVFSGYVAATAYQRAAGLAVRKLLASASDPDGDTLAVTSAGPSSNAGTTVLQAGQVLYTPPNSFSGADTFPVTITDARGASVTGTVTITVGPPPTAGGAGNNPPVLTTLPDGGMRIAFQGIPGRSYLVQRSVGGLDNWVTLATVTADASGRVSHTDESPPPGSAFYRLGPL